MRTWTPIALAAAFLAISTTSASAAVVGLALAAVQAFLATALITTSAGVLLTVGQVVGAALAVGGSLLSSVLGKPGRQNGGGIDPSAAKGLFKTSQSGEIRCMGRARVSGVKLFG